MLHGQWIDDDEALERPYRLEQPIATARPNGGSLLDVWGFGSQETSPVGLVYRALGEAPPVMCLANRAHR